MFKEEHRFSKFGHIENNIKKLWEKDIEADDEQVVVLIVGRPGKGKSTLTWWLDGFIRGEYSFKWWAFEHEDWNKLSTHKPSKKVVKYDEGRNSFTRRNAMKNRNKEALDTLAEYRVLNNFHIINFQNPKDMEMDLIHYYADLVLRVVETSTKGWVHGFGRRGNLGRIKRHQYTDQLVWPDWDFRDHFPDFRKEYPDLFAEYKKKKEENLEIKDLEEEEEEQEEEEPGMDLSGKDLVGVGEMSEYLGVNPDKVYKMGEKGVIDTYEVDGLKRFDKNSVEQAVSKIS